MIQIDHLEFSYSNEVFLKIPSWTLQNGERVFLVGPSGSGKTTFLEILSGILQPQKGRCLIDGKDFVQLSPQARDEVRKQSMSLIFQNFNLIPYLNVEENILLPFWLGYKDERTSEQIHYEMSEMLKKLGLEKHRSTNITKLSQGQAQRAAAIRAFIKRPKLLLADEPTSALDYDHRDQFLMTLFEMAEKNKTSLIFVSHDRSLERHFDRTQSILDWRNP